jgi:bacteriocin-like protein
MINICLECENIMKILNEKELKTIVGGQSLGDYAVITSGLPQVAANNPNAIPGVNDKAFDALFKAAVHKLLN